VPRGHLGLIGMRQRVDLVGGELRVESRVGKGTTISASVPADEPEDGTGEPEASSSDSAE
jgi:nitrate/nitrite-specific signal transduction histidine kinase